MELLWGRVGTPGEGDKGQLLSLLLAVKIFHSHQLSGGCWAVSCMGRLGPMCTGRFLGRPLAEAVQGCKCAAGLESPELQTMAPACGGSRAPSCERVLTCSSTVQPAHVYASLSLALFFHMHFFHLLFCPPCCYCNLSFSLCSLGCFAASYFTMSLFIPFHNNNIKTYIQGPKVPALCRYIRKDPSKPACWREKILIVSLLPGLAEAKGLIVEYDLYKTPCYILCPCWNVQSKDAGLV